MNNYKYLIFFFQKIESLTANSNFHQLVWWRHRCLRHSTSVKTCLHYRENAVQNRFAIGRGVKILDPQNRGGVQWPPPPCQVKNNRNYSDWVCTAVMSKWRYERSSRLIRNLSNCEREAWKKKFRLQRDSNPWPLRYRCSALPTELWSHNCWEQVNFSGSIMPLRVIQHYSDWFCTAVMSNDVMKDLRGWYAI